MKKTPEAVCLMPLLYFQSACIRKFQTTQGRFDLGNGITIRTITASEINEIQKDKSWPLSPADVGMIQCALEKIIHKKVNPSLPVEYDETIQQFVNLVLSMRLFKQGALGYKASYLLIENVPRIIGDYTVSTRGPSIVPVLKSIKEKTPVFSLFTLNEKELGEFSLFNKQVSRFGGEIRKWPLPIRYFTNMYRAGSYEDMLVNCMIGFEGLVFKGEKKERAKRTALALSTSMLLGRDSVEREKVKATIKEAYDVRNDIVHGQPPRKSQLQLATLCWEIEDYLRRSIQTLLIR